MFSYGGRARWDPTSVTGGRDGEIRGVKKDSQFEDWRGSTACSGGLSAQVNSYLSDRKAL